MNRAASHLARQAWVAVLLRATVICLSLAGCAHPIPVVSSHTEAADLVFRDSAGALVARTVDNRAWHGDSLVLEDGRPLHLVVNLLDFKGNELSIAERRDLEIRAEAEDGALLQWEPRRGYGLLHPFGTGRTRIRFLVWHISHPDLITPWIPVVVRAPVARATRTADHSLHP
jgi:hypothetical protein